MAAHLRETKSSLADVAHTLLVGRKGFTHRRAVVADVRREADGRTYHGIVRLRAVTEPV